MKSSFSASTLCNTSRSFPLARAARLAVLLGLACATSCTSDGADEDPEAEPDASTPAPDASTPTPDASAPIPDAAATVAPDAATSTPDAAAPPDASAPAPDAAPVEAGTPDAAVTPDASMPLHDASTFDAGGDGAAAAPSKATLDLNDVAADPDSYEWFDFRPNLLKLILAGAAETEHIAILWYTVTDGSVGLHYHSQTESVYAIDGTQTDAKGVYPSGTVYFNPPGSGHAISDSSGFFVLAYASPPDFANTDLIEEYTPVRIDTESETLLDDYDFEPSGDGVETFEVPLDLMGGMSAAFLSLEAGAEDTDFTGNYVLVLEGTCAIDGSEYGENTLVVTTDILPEAFTVGATGAAPCLAMGVSF